MSHRPWYNVFVGADMEGDSCLYVQKGTDSGENDLRYLTEEELQEIAEQLQDSLNK